MSPPCAPEALALQLQAQVREQEQRLCHGGARSGPRRSCQQQRQCGAVGATREQQPAGGGERQSARRAAARDGAAGPACAAPPESGRSADDVARRTAHQKLVTPPPLSTAVTRIRAACVVAATCCPRRGRRLTAYRAALLQVRAAVEDVRVGVASFVRRRHVIGTRWRRKPYYKCTGSRSSCAPPSALLPSLLSVCQLTTALRAARA